MSSEVNFRGWAFRTTTKGPAPTIWRWCLYDTPCYDETGAAYEPIVADMGDIDKAIASSMQAVATLQSVDLRIQHKDGAFYDFERLGGRWFRARTEVFRVPQLDFDTTADFEGAFIVDEEGAEINDDELVLDLYDERTLKMDADVPGRRIDATTFPRVSRIASGEVFPLYYGKRLFRGARFIPAYCVDNGGDSPTELEYRIVDTKNFAGHEALEVKGIDDRHGNCAPSETWNDGRWSLMSAPHLSPDIVWNGRQRNPHRRQLSDGQTRNADQFKASFELHAGNPPTAVNPTRTRIEIISEDDAIHDDFVAEETVDHTPGFNKYHPVPDTECAPACQEGAVIAKHVDPENDHCFGDGLNGFKRLEPGDNGYIPGAPDDPVPRPPEGRGVADSVGEVAFHLQTGVVGVPESALDTDDYFAPPTGTQVELNHTVQDAYLYSANQAPLAVQLGRLLFENGAIEVIRNGKVGIRRFAPTADPSLAVFEITPEIANDFHLMKERWARPFFNKFQLAARSHPLLPDQQHSSSAEQVNQDSIDFFGETIPYSYICTFLDSIGQGTFFEQRAAEIVALHGADQRLARVTIEAPDSMAEAAIAIEPGDFVTMAWSPADPTYGPAAAVMPWVDLDNPEVFLVVGVRKTRDWKNTVTLLRVFGGFGKYTDGSPMFPASLGGGSAGVWDTGWTDAQKRFAVEHFAYYGDSDTDIFSILDPGWKSAYAF